MITWRTWVLRAFLAAAALVSATLVFRPLVILMTRRVELVPVEICEWMWDAWFLSWLVAAIWSRPAAATPGLVDQAIHWTPTLAGYALLSFGSAFTYPPPLHWINAARLWVMPTWLGWIVAAACAAGLIFTWWARISLGSLWSGSVSAKEEHRVIRTGPYALVRHPIYTGLIVAAFAIGAEVGMAINLVGAALMALGFWLKARLEERFLAQQLGADAYRDYRRATPMLAPFWPVR
jgi:protein-S-isoprenylcysteine O-methyltransferase Ste14